MRVRFKPSYEQRRALRAKLAQFKQPEFVLEFLRPDLPAGLEPANVVCTVKRMHPDRFVMRAQVRSTEGRELGYALKVYSDDFGKQVWDFTHAVAEHLPPHRNGFCLPTRYDAGQLVLIFPWIEGEFLNEIVDDRNTQLLREAAKIAATLHRMPVVPAPATTAEMIVAEAQARCGRLLNRWPEVRQMIKPLLSALEEVSTSLHPVAPAPIHGDLAASQFVWTGQRLVLLDLDMFAYADPAYDAGHFLAQLDRRCVLDPSLREHRFKWLASFRDSYLEAMPHVSPLNVAFYHSVTLIRKIYTLCRTENPEWAQAVPQLAQNALATLEEVTPAAGFGVHISLDLPMAEREEDALTAALRETLGADASLKQWNAHPLSKRGRHRAVRYDVDANVPDESHPRHYQWLGMFYEEDARARTVAAVLRELAITDCANRGAMVFPRVLAYHAPLRLLLLTHETGKALTTKLAQHTAKALQAIGRALAALHATRVTLERTATVADLLDDLQARITTLCARFPAESDSLRHLLETLEQEAPADPVAPSFLLGDLDLGPSQFLWQSGRIVVLNFDAATSGDPALDVGALLAQLRRLTLERPGKLPEFASLRRDFLAAYQHWSTPDPDLLERVDWYEQVMLLHKIHFLSSDTVQHKDEETTQQRRAEANRLLAELPRLLESDESQAGRSLAYEISAKPGSKE